jgi:hypothetical protein
MSFYYSDTEALKHYRQNRYTLTEWTIKLLHPIHQGELAEDYNDRIRGYFKIYSDNFNEITNGKRFISPLPNSFLEREYQERRDIDRFLHEQELARIKQQRALEAKEKLPIFTLPGHKYLGPGNTLHGQAPLDRDDANSEKHDIAYSNAETQGDIEKADKEFIHDAISDVLETGNPHSILGALGIGIKAAAEKVVGPIYPGKWLTSLLLHYVLLTNQ